MKQIKFFILIILGLIITSCNNKIENDRFYQNLNGNVKSVRLVVYDAVEKFGEIEKGNISYWGNSLIEFDKDGYITNISEFNRNGSVDRKTIYKRYEDHRIDEIYIYNQDGNLFSKDVYTYDNNNLLTQILTYNSDGLEESSIKYENDGKHITKIQYFTNYNDGGYYIKEYEGDKEVRSIEYDKNGKKIGIRDLEYNSKGEITKFTDKDCIVSMLYDKYNNIISIENGQVIFGGSHGSGFAGNKDENYTYQYEYDKNNNWIKVIEFESKTDKPTEITEREIEYY